MADLDPETALFVGGFVAVLFLLAAGLTYVAAPGQAAVVGLAAALAVLGGLFLAVGVAGALLLHFVGE